MIKNRLVLIDAFALIYRAFHAIPPLTNKNGQLVNAVYGFTSALLSAIKDLEPKYLAVGIDISKPTLRHKEFKDYKAHRPPTPKELKAQIPYVKEVLKTFNIPFFGVEGYEGEDVIATIVAKVKSKKKKGKTIESIIVTGDLDTLQLVDKNTKVYSMARGINNAVMYDIAKVKERYGLTPSQFVDFKALKGDPSDNIPGVPGIGEKSASKLITEFKNLENIYQNLEKISQKTATLLKDNKEQAFLSRKLSKIVTNVPLDFKLENSRIHDYNQKEVIKLFEQFGFKSLIKRLPDSKDIAKQEKLF